MKERKDVYKLPVGDKTLEWYGKAVSEMRKRPINDPTSWYYQAAIHGYDGNPDFWDATGTLPVGKDRLKFWNQCQHGSWFFLPWHRMYLAYFEQIVGQTIIDLGGPLDWALPFWNYSDATNPDALKVPPAFLQPNAKSNGLWIDLREGDQVIAGHENLRDLDPKDFIGSGRPAGYGFGGGDTPFSHDGSKGGSIEMHIHGNVHMDISGAMGSFETAGLDPLFWLHHANIDRLWQVWLNLGERVNPSVSSWLDFSFEFHDKSKKVVSMKCKDVEDTRNVLSGYTYQDVLPDQPTSALVASLKVRDLSVPLDIVAATTKKINLAGAMSMVQLDLAPSKITATNFAFADEAFTKPLETFLNVENVKGKGKPPVHDVYINSPDENGDGKNEEYYAGSISLFGIEEASKPSLHHSGSGQNYTLNVSDLMNRLRKLPNWNDDKLDIQIVPCRKMNSDAEVTIGRISLYSE
jgi:tyrosinase